MPARKLNSMYDELIDTEAKIDALARDNPDMFGNMRPRPRQHSSTFCFCGKCGRINWGKWDDHGLAEINDCDQCARDDRREED